jgi:transposase InsO family protein
VDQSKALSHNNFDHSTEILLAKYCLSFGVPKAITVDNGTQFDAETFKDFCDRIGTKIHFASVRHPESNGLVERAN